MPEIQLYPFCLLWWNRKNMSSEPKALNIRLTIPHLWFFVLSCGMNVIFQPLFYVANVTHYGKTKSNKDSKEFWNGIFPIPVNGARLSVPGLSPRNYARVSEFLDST